MSITDDLDEIEMELKGVERMVRRAALADWICPVCGTVTEDDVLCPKCGGSGGSEAQP